MRFDLVRKSHSAIAEFRCTSTESKRSLRKLRCASENTAIKLRILCCAFSGCKNRCTALFVKCCLLTSGTISSLTGSFLANFDLGYRPWSVARLLNLQELFSYSHPSEKVGYSTTTKAPCISTFKPFLFS